jgi:type IV secretion system protein VirD4
VFDRFLGWLIGLFESKPPPKEDRGASWARFEEIKGAGLLSGAGIPLGITTPEPVPDSPEYELSYAGENHLFTVGKPGTGKGTTTIIPALLLYPGSCIVIDPKGQNAAVTSRARGLLGHKVYILNPFNVLADHLNAKGEHVKNLAGFNPLDRIKAGSDSFVADVRSLAQALIVTGNSNDSHFPDAARELVAALIMHVCINRTGDKRNLGEVRALLSSEGTDATENNSNKKEAKPSPWELLIDDMTQSDFQPLRQKAAQFAYLTKEVQSIISTARTQLAFLDDPAICQALASSDFCFADLKREKITVYLVLPFKQMEAQGRWLRLLITSALEELTDEPRPGDGRVLFMLDEFAQLGRLPAIERALALVRGYGVQLWPFVQDLPQLKSVYPNRWESFLSSAGVVQFFTPNDKMTAEYMSDRCGKYLAKRSGSSVSQSGAGSSSSSTSYSDQWEPLFSPWQLYGKAIRSDRQMVFLEGLSPVVWVFRRRPYYDDEISHLADPDPFHL